MHFVSVPASLLHSQRFDDCVRYACHELSAKQISNYFHDYPEPRMEFFDPAGWCMILIDYHRQGISFIETTRPASAGFSLMG